MPEPTYLIHSRFAVTVYGPDSLSLTEAEACRRLLDYDRLAALADAGERFKRFCHDYLDAHGVPHGDPENQHQREGCRIGARLDILIGQRDAARDDATMDENELRSTEEALLLARDELARVRARRNELARVRAQRDALKGLLERLLAWADCLRPDRDDSPVEEARAALDACKED